VDRKNPKKSMLAPNEKYSMKQMKKLVLRNASYWQAYAAKISERVHTAVFTRPVMIQEIQ
jgi:molecular chaperone DnaK (HSP70)